MSQQETSQTKTPRLTLQDVVDANNGQQVIVEESSPGESSLALSASSEGAVANTALESHTRDDQSLIITALDRMSNAIAALPLAQSSTDINNLLGGIVSIFKDLPNGGDDEIANRLSEAVGPDGKKLFESKEEAARFIAKMRALNSNRLSSIKGGGSGQKTGIQLNITNKVVSNVPRKPFIVDTHPIPYQY